MRHRLPAALAAVLLLAVSATVAVAGAQFATAPPGDARDALARAERALIAGDEAEARREIERAIEKAPDYAPAYHLYSDAVGDAADLRRAVVARYRALAEASPDRAAPWYALVRLST